MDHGKQRVVTELGLGACSSVSTQVHFQRNSLRNRRNRVRESKGSKVSVCANWPPDALFVRETSSPSSDEAKSFDSALFEAKICSQAFSNTIVYWARNAVVFHQVHRGSVAHTQSISKNNFQSKGNLFQAPNLPPTNPLHCLSYTPAIMPSVVALNGQDRRRKLKGWSGEGLLRLDNIPWIAIQGLCWIGS
ncbi:hypothetical protein Cgig2_009282 [Carnegiea gigantea]|uniref:Uncharacterized protein n=1 Tax=Carnegiea gigantea TaxID=171969 RepID=A0A9Q1GNJ4_9CARY|nr:hypothetical protein Cgig2_009282 [Carnegiea gigantea]